MALGEHFIGDLSEVLDDMDCEARVIRRWWASAMHITLSIQVHWARRKQIAGL